MIKSIEEVLERASKLPERRVAVAAAHDEDVMEAVCKAGEMNIANFILIGDSERIERMAEDNGFAGHFEIVNAESDADCARQAVRLASIGEAGCIMKGQLSTAEMMRAVIDKEHGIRTEGLISHTMFYEVPAYHKLLCITDGGMNPAPDMDRKVQILENAAQTLIKLGYEHINASCLCGAELVNPKIQSTVDAAAIAEMTERWGKYNMNVIGPVALDLAISSRACEHKGYSAPGCGDADILLVPCYEVGNSMGKAMTYFANAKSAGIIVGAKMPIILTSRADNFETKLASIALGCLVS